MKICKKISMVFFLSLVGASAFASEISSPKFQQKYIFIHGLGGSSKDWDEIVQKIGPDAVGVTMLCHADRNCPDELSLADMVEDLHSQLDSGPKILVGLSMGSVVALHYAKKYPEHLQKIVLVNGAPSFKPMTVLNYWQVFLRKMMVRFLPLSCIADRMVGRIFKRQDKEFIDPIKERFANHDREKYVIATKATLDHHLDDVDLKNILVPTLILCAEEDYVVPPEMCKKLQQIPGSTLQMIPGARHAFPLEDASFFLSLMGSDVWKK